MEGAGDHGGAGAVPLSATCIDRPCMLVRGFGGGCCGAYGPLNENTLRRPHNVRQNSQKHLQDGGGAGEDAAGGEGGAGRGGGARGPGGDGEDAGCAEHGG